jgi:hypothetical protein
LFLTSGEAEGVRIAKAIRFIRNLKALIRSLNGTCLISVDEDLLPKTLVKILVFLSDSAYKLTSFKGKQRNHIKSSLSVDHQEMKIGEYDGTIKLLK